jgi:tRNA nucleotidyltransferase (CCA-adding enzyme)
MELMNIFEDNECINTGYGSVRLIYKNNRFEITTFRKEAIYLDNRHPSKVTYINNLEEDLQRRDFTINALCLDKDGNLIDLIGGKKDLDNHLLKTIGDSDASFKSDALRIIRAIRFASYLDFELSIDIKKAIINNKGLLKKLSYERKKKELDKIFGSKKAKEGINLIKEFNLEEELEINFERVNDYSDIVGIWAMINTKVYPFTASEKDLIKKVNIVYSMDNLNNEVLYQYGLYVNILAGINKGLKKKDILRKYDLLPIKKRDEINISAKEICGIYNKEAGAFIGEVYSKLEKLILNHVLENDNLIIKEYIMENKDE